MYLFDGTVCRNRLTISSIMIVHPVTTVRDEVLHKEDGQQSKKKKKKEIVWVSCYSSSVRQYWLGCNLKN